MRTDRKVLKYLRHIGMGFVYIGALLLIICYATGLADKNILLIISAILIIAGTIIHIYKLKNESRY